MPSVFPSISKLDVQTITFQTVNASNQEYLEIKESNLLGRKEDPKITCDTIRQKYQTTKGGAVAEWS